MSMKIDQPVLLSARSDRVTSREVRKFRPDIGGLRAVAVTLVVLSHLSLGFPGGYVGVDVFFVISGFLITRQLTTELNHTNRISFSAFYARRIRRILPAATVVIFGVMLACWRWDSPLRVRSDATDGLFSTFSAFNWRLAEGGANYFQAALPPSPLQHFWSLAVEEQFYAIWPVFLLFIGVTAGRRYGRRKSLVWSLLLIMAASLFLSIWTTPSSPSWAYFGTQTRAWELALGALLAVTADVWTRMPPALASQMSWLGLGMIALSSLVYDSSTVYPGSAVVLPVAGSAFVIAGGCPGWSRSAEIILKRRPVQFIGMTSYSWYLVHWPMLTIVPWATGHPLTTAGRWLVLSGSLAIAVLIFYTVEQPIRSGPLAVKKPLYSLILGCSLIAASIGTMAVISDRVTIPGGTDAAHPVAAASGLQVVEKAIAAGTRLEKLTENVTPSLDKAALDRSFTTEACLAGFSVTVPPPDQKCTFGDVGSHRIIAVVGDSHANAWSPAIDAFAKANGWRFLLLAKAGCPAGVYPFYISDQTDRIYTACNEWRNAVFSRLKKVKPTIVLIANELRTIDIDPTGMVRSIHEFQSAGARVIYLKDTPQPLKIGSVPDCLAAHPSHVQQCSISRKDPSSRLDNFIQRQAEASAAKLAGATVIDPSPWFCGVTICPPVINHIIVYADSTHPTATYTSWLSPVMSAALKKAIAEGS